MKRRVITFKGSTRNLEMVYQEEFNNLIRHGVNPITITSTGFYKKIETKRCIYIYQLASTVTREQLEGQRFDDINGRAWLPMNLWKVIDSRLNRGGE